MTADKKRERRTRALCGFVFAYTTMSTAGAVVAGAVVARMADRSKVDDGTSTVAFLGTVVFIAVVAGLVGRGLLQHGDETADKDRVPSEHERL